MLLKLAELSYARGELRPKVFIGSAVNALKTAYAVQQNLEYDADPIVWDQGIFNLSRSAAESLVKALDEVDFAIFIFTAEDVLNIGGETKTAARDNVIFELGLFMGRLGRDRTFMFLPRQHHDFHLPTDLIGFTPATYNAERQDHNFRAATGPATNEVREAISRLGSRFDAPENLTALQRVEEPEGTRKVEGEEPASPDQSQDQVQEEVSESTPDALREPINEMIMAFYDGDEQRGEAAYERAQDAEDDADEKMRLEAMYLSLQYGRGDVAALSKLHDLAQRAKDSPAILPIVHNFIGGAV